MEEQETIQSEAKPEIHPKKSLGGSLRWGMVTVLAFGLGALIILLALYVPNWQKLDKANASLISKTDQSSTLQTGNETLQKNLDSTTLHMYVLKALSGVSRASLAVTANDYAGARLSLIQASEALDTLSSLLGTDHKMCSVPCKRVLLRL